MFSVETKVGRLLEVRLKAPFAPGEMEQLTLALGAAFVRVPGRLVGCIDMRGSMLLSPEEGDHVAAWMRSGNAKIERSGVVIPQEAPVYLQVARVFRETGHPGRRVFVEKTELMSWLGEVLDDHERQRMQAFLDEDEEV